MATTSLHLTVTGLVQGVGFRPWVARQARALGLAGWVKNTGVGVALEVHGATDAVETFQRRLAHEAPGRVEAVLPRAAGPHPGATTFEILPSDVGAAMAAVAADTGVCDACLEELFDPRGRRFLHPFVHCPSCGPRFTIQRGVPFDRSRTSLAPFAECAACVAEGSDPGDRRFHDQTNACPACGPRLWWRTRDGETFAHSIEEPDSAIARAADILERGGVLALKGVGGFHLVARATAVDGIDRIRRFKDRPAKPLGLMVRDVASLARFAEVTAAERRALEAPARPLVLVRVTGAGRAALSRVAPGQGWLGAMLPSAPVHHLLFWEAAGRPSGPWTSWSSSTAASAPWVVTSANRRGEPLIVDNDDAIAALGDVVDGWLLHDRAIVARADDSVLRVRADGSACVLRRARGFAPLPVPRPRSAGDEAVDAPSVLALGVDEKATVAIARADVAGGVALVPSAFIGGLSSPAGRAAHGAVVDAWAGQLAGGPQLIACDAHPDLHTSRLARAWSSRGSALVEVGHHHAHVAAVLAEHVPATSPPPAVVALALDGHGHGDDGGAWGGELLLVEGDRCRRLGHLWPLALVGGDRAAREPWRLAAAALVALGRVDAVQSRFADEPHAAAVAMLAGRDHTSRTTSLGRLFDAAAALLGGPRRTSFEAEAPLWLEGRAADAGPAAPPMPAVLQMQQGEHIVLDWRPLLAGLTTVDRDDDDAVASAACAFHDEVVRGLAGMAVEAARADHVDTVVLAGGCLANRRLDEGLTSTLQAAGLKVWRSTHLPCGDGALAVGQAWVAIQRWRRGLAPTC